MPTIQFTYDKKEQFYCFGFWVDEKFIVRGKSRDKKEIWKRFCKELKILEESEN